MADSAQSIASNIFTHVLKQVVHQLGYIISYERNVDSLKVDAERLKEAKDVIQHSVDAATRDGDEIERTVKHWLKEVDDMVAEAEKLQNNEDHAKAACSCGHFPNLWARHQLSMKAKEIAQGISQIIQGGRFQTISFKPRLLVGITSSYARGYEALDSRTSLLNEIMQTLKDANVCKVGVCGMGGVGKSTLIKELAWKAVQDGSYDVVVSANVTNSPDVKKIQAEIAESLGMKLNEETLGGRASRLRERIPKEESILIIMDDIWEKLDLTEVGVPFGDDHKGCKLLFTSRNLNVLTNEMDVQERFCFRLEVLSKEESWSLFEKKVGDVIKDSNLRSTALKVAEACGGLPVLIIPMANALKNKGLPAWDDALKQLTRFDHKNLSDKVYSAIELSYNHLANDELKSLFLLLGSYGQTILWTRYLLIDFWSLGLYRDADSLVNARNRLYNLVAELKSACLLLEEEGESVKIHDLVHEVASKLASKDRPIFAVKQYSELKEWPEMDRLRKCYRMFLPDCRLHDLPESLECPELEMLELGSRNNFLKVSDHFFAETKELKNLFLGGMDCTPSLPLSLSHLPKLRALLLYECMLEDITLVEELKNLEILGFDNSEIRKLPTVIGKLTRIRILNLSNISGLRAIPAKLISSLTHLEELYIGNTFIQWEDEGSESQSKNASLDELRHLHQLTALEIMIQDASVLPKDLLIFGQLDKYRIYIGDEWKRAWNSTTSKRLKLNQGKAKNIHLDQGVKLLLNNVEELCLSNLNGVRNVLYQLNEEGFPQLKYLDVQSSNEMQYIIDSKERGHSCKAFPKLESLVLHNLANMRKICHGPLPVHSFTELKVIKVKGCDRLEYVLLFSMIKDLFNLLEFEISQCKTMSEIIIDDDTEIDKIEFPQLHSLTIDCIPNLADFYSKPLTADMELRSVIEYEDDPCFPEPLFDEKSRLLVGITSSYARGYEALDSRTSLLNEIMQTLKDANVCKVGVCGMGGVGKSTLIKELAWKAVQDGSYDVVVSANVTNSPDVKKIQAEIAESLGMKLNEETLGGRASRLRERIRKEESILIIMDDIWEKLDLTEVGVPFGDDHKGCKLLFTSRNLNVLTDELDVQERFCFRLEVLSKEESWSLFEKKVGDAVKDSNLRPTALKVAEACGGLPVLIIPVANALKNKRLPAWDDALKQLTRFDHKNLTAKVYSAIELTYNHLANDELKSLFLLLGSFGQTKIWTRYLLIYFWSSGLYEDADSLAHARNRLDNLVTELKSACLLLEEGQSVKMHDRVHEVASKLASKDRPIFAVKQYSELKEWPEMDRLRKCYRMFLPDCRLHDLPESLECPELEMLELGSQNNFLKVLDHFFAGTKELKLLFLRGMDCTPSLPSSLSHLPKLRALLLYECMLEDVTLVEELKNLEILGFENSEIRKLPTVIRKLTRLRLLNLSNISGLRAIPAKLISSLTRLEELYMANTFIQWEDEGSKSQSKNASLGELRHLHQLTALEITIQDASVLPKDLLIFGQLDKYRIYIGDEWKRYWNSTTSKRLKLNQGKTKNIHLDQGVKLLLNNVEELCLSNLNGVRNVLYQLNEEGFPQLKHLDVQRSDEIQYIIDSKEWRHSCEAFPQLESLVLHNLANMSKICNGPLPVQSFMELKVIKVKGCDRLENVFLCSMIKDLSKLLEVEISQCKTMSEIVIDDDTEIDQIEFPQLHSLTIDCVPSLVSFYYKPMTADMELRSVTEYEDDSTIPAPLFDEKISFPNLESLKLSSINLRKIWDDQLSQHSCIKKLKSLIIDGCGNLKFLFPSSVARGLVNLQHLNISGCGMLEEIFFIDGKMDNLPSAKVPPSNYEAAFPSLETLVISHMDSLKSIWNSQLVSNSFPKLIKLEISFCNKLMNVLSSYELKHLSNLETMLVSRCDSLEGVFQIEGLNSCSISQHGLQTQLRALTLEHLPTLKHIWNKDPRGSLGFQNLCTVKVFKCQSLNFVFPLSVAMELKKLEVLEISSCGIVHIVAKEEMAEIAPKLVLQQLKSLKLWDLTKARNFCYGMQTLECPNLKKLDVIDCDKLEIFVSKSQNCQDVVDQQPLFSLEKVIQSIEELSLSSEDVTLICNDQQSDDSFYKVKALRLHRFNSSDEFPTSFLQRFTNLEQLKLYASCFKSVPLSEHAETNSKLKTLTLASLWYLDNICQEKSHMEKILHNLETLEVFHCSILKTIAPSFVIFQNLDTLWVSYCATLVNIISSSTARSLLRLRMLFIYNCDMLEEFVVSEDDDAGEIALVKLEVMVLQGLPRLTSFCNGNRIFKFPLLEELCMVECPMMETFSQGVLSAPLLRKVYVTEGGDKWRWNGDLNTTITTIFRQSHSEEV